MNNLRDSTRDQTASHHAPAVAARIPEDDDNPASVLRLTVAQPMLDGFLLGTVLYLSLQIAHGPATMDTDGAIRLWDRMVIAGVAALSLMILLAIVGPTRTNRIPRQLESGIVAASVALSIAMAAMTGALFLGYGLIESMTEIVAGGLLAIAAIVLERSLVVSVTSSNRLSLWASHASALASLLARRAVEVDCTASRTNVTRSSQVASPARMPASSRVAQPVVADRAPALIDVVPVTRSAMAERGLGAGPGVIEAPSESANAERGPAELAWNSTDVAWERRSTETASRTIKRLVDVAVSLSALLMLSPLMLVLATLVKLETRGPVLFVQSRVGQHGKIFNLLKFRSMRADAETLTGPIFARPNDPRCTRVGRFMRRHSLDELPQLINVLRGDMSIVGPRPERPYFVVRFNQSIPHYVERHREKAGITGWAQVNGRRGDTSIEERVEYDLYYVKNWSLAFDLKIMALTIIEILQGHNAY